MTRPIEPAMRANLLKLARAYSKQYGYTLGSLSVMAHGDSRFFEKLASGKGSFVVRKYDEVLAWFTIQARFRGFKMPLLVDLKHHQRTTANGSKTKTIRNRKKENGRDKAASSG